MDWSKKKRVARVPRFGPSSINVSRQRNLSSSSSENEGKVEHVPSTKGTKKKILASGSVSNHRTLDSKKFKSILQADKQSMIEESERRNLRTRPENLNLNEHMLVDQYYNIAYAQSLANENKKIKLDEDENAMDDDDDETPETFVRELSGRTLDWDVFLQKQENLQHIPPMEFFKNVPLADIWNKDFAKVGLAIELINPFVEEDYGFDLFWIGTIVHFAGYRALIKFETFDDTKDSMQFITWISFCSSVPKPLGFCEKNNKTLFPGPIISDNVRPFLDQYMSEFYKKETIKENHLDLVGDSIKKLYPFDDPNIPVEAFDVEETHQTRLAKITAICGDRIHIVYSKDYNNNPPSDHDRNGWWFSVKSKMVHRLGWSKLVGIECISEIPNELENFSVELSDRTIAFPYYHLSLKIEEGMLLETRHPLFPHMVVGATIEKVLNHGYFIIETLDNDITTRTQFCYHITSPYIFKWGWAKSHNIPVQYSKKEVKNLKPKHLKLPKRNYNNQFYEGLKVEIFDILQPEYCESATIMRVCDNMLFLHYDGWPENDRNFVWVDHQSDIYPIGYCEMIGMSSMFRSHVSEKDTT